MFGLSFSPLFDKYQKRKEEGKHHVEENVKGSRWDKGLVPVGDDVTGTRGLCQIHFPLLCVHNLSNESKKNPRLAKLLVSFKQSNIFR